MIPILSRLGLAFPTAAPALGLLKPAGAAAVATPAPGSVSNPVAAGVARPSRAAVWDRTTRGSASSEESSSSSSSEDRDSGSAESDYEESDGDSGAKGKARSSRAKPKAVTATGDAAARKSTAARGKGKTVRGGGTQRSREPTKRGGASEVQNEDEPAPAAPSNRGRKKVISDGGGRAKPVPVKPSHPKGRSKTGNLFVAVRLSSAASAPCDVPADAPCLPSCDRVQTWTYSQIQALAEARLTVPANAMYYWDQVFGLCGSTPDHSNP